MHTAGRSQSGLSAFGSPIPSVCPPDVTIGGRGLRPDRTARTPSPDPLGECSRARCPAQARSRPIRTSNRRASHSNGTRLMTHRRSWMQAPHGCSGRVGRRVRAEALEYDRRNDLNMLRWAITLCCVTLATPMAGALPDVTWSTYLGVADCDDAALWQGDLFLACHSPASLLPVSVSGSVDRDGIMAAYLLRLDVERGQVVYATRVGADAFTAALRIKIDEQGFAYVTGLTKGSEFPVTENAVQPRFGGGPSDAFLVSLSPRGQLSYATFLGGEGDDVGNALALDGQGGVFVAGTTNSGSLPGRSNTGRESADAFIAFLRPSNASSLNSVAFGGSAEEKLSGVAVDGRGGVFAVGYTKSHDFPVLNPVQPVLRGTSDVFVTRLSVPSLTIAYSTYLGGSGDDSGWGVAIDGAGAPVVAGITDSTDLATSRDAFQRTAPGGLNAFVARLDGSEYDSVQLTYFGGSRDDSSGFDGSDIAVDASGRVWLVGFTSSSDLPVRDALQEDYGGETDGFVAAFSPDLSQLEFSTYRGGSKRDVLEGLDVDSGGRVAVTGLTFSDDLPMPGPAIQDNQADIFVGGQTANAMVLVLRTSRP